MVTIDNYILNEWMMEWIYIMFVWKDECGESVHIIVVWCDLNVWYISWQKKERMRVTYARTIEGEHGDEKQLWSGSMRDEIESESMRVKHHVCITIYIKSINNQCVCYSIHWQGIQLSFKRGTYIFTDDTFIDSCQRRNRFRVPARKSFRISATIALLSETGRIEN